MRKRQKRNPPILGTILLGPLSHVVCQSVGFWIVPVTNKLWTWNQQILFNTLAPNTTGTKAGTWFRPTSETLRGGMLVKVYENYFWSQDQNGATATLGDLRPPVFLMLCFLSREVRGTTSSVAEWSALRLGGCWFNPWVDHTKDYPLPYWLPLCTVRIGWTAKRGTTAVHTPPGDGSKFTSFGMW